MSGISKADWLPLAQLLRPQGRRGELLAEPLTDLSELFADGREVFLASASVAAPAPGALPTHLEGHWQPTGKNAGRVVLKLAGCNSISEAEAIAGQQLLIPSAELPALNPDTFFVGDLVGCTLYNGSAPAGIITDVEFATGPDGRTRLEDAAPLLAVELTPGADPILVPFVRAWLDSVDIVGRHITMHLPEGLLEITDDEVASDDSVNDPPQ